MTGHAWPLTSRRSKNSEPKSELHKDKYAPDQAVLGTSYQEALENRTLRREERRGQLRLSLTNTYHEWPDKGILQPSGRFPRHLVLVSGLATLQENSDRRKSKG